MVITWKTMVWSQDRCRRTSAKRKYVRTFVRAPARSGVTLRRAGAPAHPCGRITRSIACDVIVPSPLSLARFKVTLERWGRDTAQRPSATRQHRQPANWQTTNSLLPRQYESNGSHLVSTEVRFERGGTNANTHLFFAKKSLILCERYNT